MSEGEIGTENPPQNEEQPVAETEEAPVEDTSATVYRILRESGTSTTGRSVCFGSNLGDPFKRPVKPEPEVFYQTTASDIHPDWKITGTMSIDKADVPPISTVMGLRRKSNVNYPLKTTVDPGKYELLSATQKYEQSLFGEPVLTAHVRQRKFPVTSEDLVYPEASRMGATNPLYALASQDIGNEPPKAHQMPGRYFPRSTKFSSAFTTSNPRDTGLNTSISWSKVHPTLDQMY